MSKVEVMAKKPRNILDLPLVVAKESFRSFMRNNGLGTSASLAYYGFFAFIPLAFIVIAFISSYVVSSEMTMLFNTPRVATALVAVPGTQLAIILRSNFETMLHDNPEFVLTILKSIAARLRKADEHFCSMN